ncbi:MAG: ankyrin repeat domain-containing protein, partial [Cyanobacteria bacterium]|nr:ankyrin repeat domain-containing protein [Cyanobacteriota bacterium]
MLTTNDPIPYKLFNTPNQTNRPFFRVSQIKGYHPTWNYPILFAGNSPQDTFILQEQQNNINAKDKNGYTALIRASKDGHKTVVEKLLKHPSIDINAEDNYGRTALIFASDKGHDTVVEKLLNHPKTDINAKSKNGISALAWASRNGHKTVAEKFLNHPNIDVNDK